MPKSIDKAYKIDKANSNSLWTNTIRDKMPKIIHAIKKYEGTEKELENRGFNEITGHMIFDVKLSENF